MPGPIILVRTNAGAQRDGVFGVPSQISTTGSPLVSWHLKLLAVSCAMPMNTTPSSRSNAARYLAATPSLRWLRADVTSGTALCYANDSTA